jgi:hypothetical protein
MKGSKDSSSLSKKADNSLTSKNKTDSVSTKISNPANSTKTAENNLKINTKLSTWEAQLKRAIRNGDKPETDLFEAMENTFDKEEW